MIIKEIKEYDIPYEYKTIILDFYRNTLAKLGNKLLLFVIGR